MSNEGINSDSFCKIEPFQALITEIIESNNLLRRNDRVYVEVIRVVHEELASSIADGVLLDPIDKQLHLSDNGDVSRCQQVMIFNDMWLKIQKPLFDWFREWKHSLSKQRKRGVVVELRQLSHKLTKIFKIMHRFYYQILEKLISSVKISEILPSRIIVDLNLRHFLKHCVNPSNAISSNDPKSVVYLCVVYQCMFYLGKIHYWLVLLKCNDELINTHQIQKSKRYLQLCRILIPSESKTFAQFALLHIKTGDIINALYFSIRSISGRECFKSNKYLFGKILNQNNQRLTGLQKGAIQSVDIKFLLVIILKEFYVDSNIVGDFRNHIMSTFYNKLKVLLINAKEEGLVLRIVGIIVGFFQEIIRKDGLNVKSMRVHTLTNNHELYLQWALIILSEIIYVIMDKDFRIKYEKYEYLASVRLIMCWIKSNKVILQFAHRNINFCRKLAESINNFANFDVYGTNLHARHRPIRPYLFEEDVLLHDFSCIDFMLSDFNDNDLLRNSPSIDKLYGCPGEKEVLDNYSENLLRLTAVVSSILKFLGKDIHGICWNSNTRMYESENLSDSFCKDRLPFWETANILKKERSPKREMSLMEFSRRLSPKKQTPKGKTFPLTSIGKLSRESTFLNQGKEYNDEGIKADEKNPREQLETDEIDVSLDLSSIHENTITSSQSDNSTPTQVVINEDIITIDSV